MHYEVSDLGRVRSLPHMRRQANKYGGTHEQLRPGKILAPGRMPGGHVSVSLGRGNNRCVHELVLLAFIGPPLPGQMSRHKNGTPADNVLPNLEWSSRGRNEQDKKHHAGAAGRLLASDVRTIKRALLAPYRGVQTDLAKRFSVSAATVSHIKCGRSHADIVI